MAPAKSPGQLNNNINTLATDNSRAICAIKPLLSPTNLYPPFSALGESRVGGGFWSNARKDTPTNWKHWGGLENWYFVVCHWGRAIGESEGMDWWPTYEGHRKGWLRRDSTKRGREVTMIISCCFFFPRCVFPAMSWWRHNKYKFDFYSLRHIQSSSFSQSL